MELRAIGTWALRIVVAVALLGSAIVAFRPGTSESAAVRFRDPTVWLPTTVTGEVVQVNGTTGEVIARVLVGEAGDDVAAVQRGAGAIVLNGSKGELSLLDATTLTQRLVVPVSDQDPVLVDGGDRVFAVAEDAVVAVVGDTLHVDAEVEVTSPRSPVAASDGSLWFLDDRGALRHLPIDTVVTEVTGLPPTSSLELAALGEDVYLVDGGNEAVVRVAGDGLASAACLGGAVAAPGPTAASTATGAIVVPDPEAGTVHIARPGSGDCGVVDLGLGPAATGTPVVLGRSAYVPVLDHAQVAVIDLRSMELRGLLTLPGVPAGAQVELLVKDGIVWFNEVDGPLAGILDEERIVRLVDKRIGGVTGDGIGGVVAGDSGDVVGVGQGGDGVAPGGDGGDGGGEGEGDDGAGGDGTGSEPPADAGEDPTEDQNNPLIDDLGRIIAQASPAPPTPQSQTPEEEEEIPPAPDELVADFTFSAGTVSVGETVTFTDRSHGGPTSWTWDFGDGTVASGPNVEHAWTAPGVYSVVLLVENATAADDTTVVIRVVEPEALPPRADFTFSSAQTEVNAPITFTDTSRGEDLTRRWELGDGSTDTAATVRKSWNRPGTYVVRLTVTNQAGSDSEEVTITVVDRVTRPTVQIQASSTSLLVGQTASFSSTTTGNPTTLEWRFGDGTTERGATARHAWTRAGTYTVELLASNSAGESRATVTVTVAEPVVAPVARFATSAASVETGSPVTFTSTSTGDPTSWSWDFGDGTTGTGSTVSKTYARPGNFTVRLTVENSAGSSSTTRTVTVVANLPLPIPSFTVAPATLRSGEAVQFTDTSTGGPVATRSWDFGDGSATSAVKNPSHIFEEPGTYVVTLATTNIAGTATTTRTLQVLPPIPVAGFSFTPATPQQGVAVQFTDTSVGTPTSWAWDFGNGQTATVANPSMTFADPGTYPVTLTVRNAGGSSTITRRVAVSPPPPSAAFQAPSRVIVGQSVPFANATTGAEPIQFSWDFGDGTGSTERSPAHTFAAPGNFRVTLTATNAGGSTTFSRTVEVRLPDRPDADFTVSPSTVVAGQPVTFTNTSDVQGVATYLWEFGDGTTSTQATPPPKVYATPATYTVRLTVTNAGGQDTKTATVKVDPVPPAVPGFTAAASELTVRVTNTSTGAASATVNWGDGSAPQPLGATVDHTYAAPGAYTVTVTAVNSAGAQASTAKTVRVLRASASGTVNNLTVSFTGGVTGAPAGEVSFTWDFGDGGGATGPNPTHTYAAAGDYTARLTVSWTAAPSGVTAVSVITVPVKPTNPPPSTTTTGSTTTPPP